MTGNQIRALVSSKFSRNMNLRFSSAACRKAHISCREQASIRGLAFTHNDGQCGHYAWEDDFTSTYFDYAQYKSLREQPSYLQPCQRQ